LLERKSNWVVGGLIILTIVLALSACGVPGLGAAKPTPTPDAEAILAKMQETGYKDIESTMTISGNVSGVTVSGHATAVTTTSPKRVKLSLTYTTGGQTMMSDWIEDTDSNKVYVKFSGAVSLGAPTGEWVTSDAYPDLILLISTLYPDLLTSFGGISNPKLKGSEKVDGEAVWHLTCASKYNGNDVNTDLYVRQKNSDPYKAVVHASGRGLGDATIIYTGINTGATVELPPPIR